METATGRIFRSRDVVFKEGVAHRTRTEEELADVSEDEVDGEEGEEGDDSEGSGGAKQESVPTVAKDEDRAYGLARSHTTLNATDDPHPTSTDEKSLVVVLERALYGTVDGARNWSIALGTEMKDLGYYESRADQSVRTRVRDGEHTITATYSDDVTGATTTREGYKIAMAELGRKFKVKDMGELKFVIGMGVDRNWATGVAKSHPLFVLIVHEPYVQPPQSSLDFPD
ncbi:hypothetical protein D9619_008338 [Psilocybe cf. subviscida]|uniref:Reverse transcriptase Ty1/copia-type domain-containing protein n=1 Tax=Psilocybe cf. subviscida TaxID=2480587 RepID=A0A8H5BAB0_9AGAR|nr:hypothetical protein D9619_008338 [Psilocybe cf. subviscida]